MHFKYTLHIGEHRLAFFEGGDVPPGLEDAAAAAERKAEDLKPAIDALKTRARSMESTLRTDAKIVRENASAMVRIDVARFDFRRYWQKYITKEQFALVHERNILLAKKAANADGSAAEEGTPEGSIVLGVTERKLRILSGSTTELESLLSPVRALERKHDPKKPTSFYKRDLDKAITDFLRNTAPTTDKILKSLTPRGTTYATFDLIKREHAEWVKNYPREYLRVLTQGIRLNPALIARLEPGREDSEYVSDKEFIDLIKKMLGEGHLGVLAQLSDDWKRNHMDDYVGLVHETAEKNPAILSVLKNEYQRLWRDIDGGAAYKQTLLTAISTVDKKKAEQEATPKALYDVSEDWLSENEANRTEYHDLFVTHATNYPKTLAHLDRKNYALFENYADAGKQGWAFIVRDVVRDEPEAVKELPKNVLADLKAAAPAVYEEIKSSVKTQPTATLSLKDPDTIRDLLERRPGDLLEELKRDPSLLGAIPYPILNDPRNREAVKTLVAAHPVLLKEIPDWQRNRNIAGELIMKNATVYAHISPSFQNEAKLILAALVAEQEGRGNFHWEWVPEEAYKDIVKLAWGGDPSAETFLTALLDPEKLKDPQKRFYFIDAMPLSALTRENLLKLSAHFYAAPEMFGRLIERMSTDPRAAALLREGLKDIDGFLFPLLTGTRPSGESAIAVPELMRYLTPETTGLGWKEIVKLAEDTRTMDRIDFKKLDLADLKKICIVLKPIDRTTMWGRLSERTLADFLIQDLVPYSGVSLDAIPVEMINEIGRTKITELQKKRLISGDVAKKLLDRK